MAADSSVAVLAAQAAASPKPKLAAWTPSSSIGSAGGGAHYEAEQRGGRPGRRPDRFNLAAMSEAAASAVDHVRSTLRIARALASVFMRTLRR